MKKLSIVAMLFTSACIPSTWQEIQGQYSKVKIPQNAREEVKENEFLKSKSWSIGERGNFYTYTEGRLAGSPDQSFLTLITNNVAATLKGETVASEYRGNCRSYQIKANSENASNFFEEEIREGKIVLSPGEFYVFGKTCIQEDIFVEALVAGQDNKREGKAFINSLKLR